MSARHSLLVTGGAGFVGSHFVRAAHEAGARIVVLDDLSGGPRPTLPVPHVIGDIGDRALVERLLREYDVTAVVHFAGKIRVSESVDDPALYFEHNVVRSLALLEAVRGKVEQFVFSSTAAVYGVPDAVPISETALPAPISPYGSTKLTFEQALDAYGTAYGMRWAALRYFNAAGAHPDGTLRENHKPETHLVPLVCDAALGVAPPVTIFGDDYPTPDGTCVRDYVHVVDLARAHLAALDVLDNGKQVGVCNLGSESGFSVREVLDAAAKVLRRDVPHVIAARRAGDPAVLRASTLRARQILAWQPQRSDLSTIIEDTLRSR